MVDPVTTMSRLGASVSVNSAAAHEFAILGPFRSRSDGEWVEASSPQAARLGAVLAAFPGQTLSVSRIVDMVWGDSAPATAASAMRVYVSQLRRQWGDDSIVASRDGYQLAAPQDAVDAYRFLALVKRAREMARRGHLRRTSELLAGALELWRGTPAVESDDVELQAFVALLLEARAGAEVELAVTHLELASDSLAVSEVIGQARRLAVLYGNFEQTHVLLARSLCLGGRRTEAFSAIDKFVAASGLPPSPTLARLRADMVRHDPLLAPTITLGFSNIDLVSPTLVGHEEAVARARRVLVDDGAHAVALVQSDGDSHDRLVGELANELRGDFPAGQVLLRLDRPSIAAVDRAVAAASKGRQLTVRAGDDPATLILFLVSDDRSVIDVLQKELASLIRAPRLVVVSTQSTGMAFEVSLDGN